jgi:Cys-rich protein (TIGR01571 family)
MKLDWSGTPDVDTPAESLTGKRAAWSAFKIMLVLFVIYQVFDNFVYFVTQPYLSGHVDSETGVYYPPQHVPLWAVVFDAIRQSISLAYGIFILVIVIRTRTHIRNLYSIPEQHCTGCEDFCCALWCSPCTVCQMARHTADYHQYKASCCTETGLDASAPHVV